MAAPPPGVLAVCLSLQLLLGLTWSDSLSPEGTEIPKLPGCNTCPPGYGVVSVCNSTHDTRCAPCPQGTYNMRHTHDFPCTPCSACTQYEYERMPCSAHQDTMCVSCFSSQGGGFGNEDFLRKCEPLTTTTTPPTTTTRTPKRPAITTTQVKTSTLPEEEENSGDLSPVLPPGDIDEPDWIVPPKTSSKLPKVTSTTTSTPKTTTTTTKTGAAVTTEGNINLVDGEGIAATTSLNESVEAPMIGAQRAEPENGASGQSWFQWPVLVAALVAAVVCFVLGLLVSALVHKHRSQSQERLTYAVDEDPVTTTMISPRRDFTREQNGRDPQSDARTPLYQGPLTMPPTHPAKTTELPIHVLPSNGPYQPVDPAPEKQPFVPEDGWDPVQSLVKKPFHASYEVPFIDEDSDDEMVQSTGRPLTLDYKDKDLIRKMAAQGGWGGSQDSVGSSQSDSSWTGTDDSLTSPATVSPPGGRILAFT